MKYFILLITLFLTGCLTESVNPLSKAGEQSLDSALIGTWYGGDDNSSSYLHIGKDKDRENSLLFLLVEIRKNGEIEISTYRGHNSIIEQNKYLNIVMSDEKEKQDKYIFAKYSINGSKLSISIADPQSLKKAIKEGSLKGRLSEERFGSALINESVDKIRSYIVANDKSIFDDYVELVKK